MAAPSAPHLRAMQNGYGQLRLAWEAVDTATNYNVYMGNTPNPVGVEDSVADGEAEADGSFVWWSGDEAGPIFVRITALNALAEESGYSNERSFVVSVDSGTQNPTPALDHIRKGH